MNASRPSSTAARSSSRSWPWSWSSSRSATRSRCDASSSSPSRRPSSFQSTPMARGTLDAAGAPALGHLHARHGPDELVAEHAGRDDHHERDEEALDARGAQQEEEPGEDVEQQDRLEPERGPVLHPPEPGGGDGEDHEARDQPEALIPVDVEEAGRASDREGEEGDDAERDRDLDRQRPLARSVGPQLGPDRGVLLRRAAARRPGGGPGGRGGRASAGRALAATTSQR